jgi:very-short-patch-repair endonuclease
MNNFYNENLKIFAHELRTESVSKAEKYLWKSLLRGNKIGVKFNRQRPIDNFIVDFFSKELGLIIEIDGSSHFNKQNMIDFDKTNLLIWGLLYYDFKKVKY